MMRTPRFPHTMVVSLRILAAGLALTLMLAGPAGASVTDTGRVQEDLQASYRSAASAPAWSGSGTLNDSAGSHVVTAQGLVDDSIYTWMDDNDTLGLLDFSALGLAITEDVELFVGVDFHSPFFGYDVGGGGDAVWLIMDTDGYTHTGNNYGGVIGAEFLLAFEYSWGDWTATLYGTPSSDVNTWTEKGSWVAVQGVSSITYEPFLATAVPLKTLGNPKQIRFILASVYYPILGDPIVDFLPEPPNTLTYGIPKNWTTPSTTTTTKAPTTTTTLPPTTTTTAPSTTTTTQPAPATTTTAPPPPSFTDVSPVHPYAEAIGDLATREIIGGYPDGSFRPSNPVWRGQFAKMIVGTLDLMCTEGMTSPFTDLGPDDPGSLYPHEYVAAAASHGITNGTSATTFDPYMDISRAQVITMVVRAAQNILPGTLANPSALYSNTWGTSFSATHGPNARVAEYNGLLAGLPVANLDPWGTMPRGEVAQVLHNLLEVIEGGPVTPPPATYAQVTQVVDGDTIRANYNGVNESIRLIGFDTPETGEPFSAEAKSALTSLVGGRTVELEFDVTQRDQYGRLLAYVWVGSTMANTEMLRKGLATLYTVPPNVKYVSTFQAAQDEAKAAKRGIWGASAGPPLEVTSIHADAAGNDHDNLNDEYIVFKVLVGGSLIGYSVEDDAGHTYYFPDRVFQAGQSFTLHTGSGTDSQTHLYWGSGSAIWNNSGDTVKVLDPQGHVVVSKSY